MAFFPSARLARGLSLLVGILFGQSLLAATIAHYRFETGPNNAAVSSIVDSGPNGLHGTVAGSLTYGSSAGGATGLYSLNAVGDSNFGRVANSTLLNPTGDFTVEAFFKGDLPYNGFGTENGHAMIAVKRWTSTPMGYMSTWELAVNLSTGRPVAGISFGGGNGQTLSGLASVLDGAWHHIALVYDKDASGNIDAMSLYLDGVLQAQSSYAMPTLATGNQNLYIGAGNFFGESSGSSFRSNFDGWIDELRLSDTALSTAQFLQIPEPAHTSLWMLGLIAIFHSRRRWFAA
jgi:hypothetical protein